MTWYPNVPKIAHFYWQGKSLSWLRYVTMLSFAKQNPDWLCKVYTPNIACTNQPWWEEESKEGTGVLSKDYLCEIPKISNNVHLITIDIKEEGLCGIPEVFRSDLLRLKWLGTDGGIWSDFDIVHFAPITKSIFNKPKVDTILSYSHDRGHFSIGYLLGSYKNPFYKFLYDKGMKELVNDGDRQTFGVKLWDKYFTNDISIKEQFPELCIENFELKVCYPYIYLYMNNILEKNCPISNEYIGLHYYAGHPDVRKWENILTPNNYKSYNTTLCNCIKKALL